MAAANPAIASKSRSNAFVGRVAEFGSLTSHTRPVSTNTYMKAGFAIIILISLAAAVWCIPHFVDLYRFLCSPS